MFRKFLLTILAAALLLTACATARTDGLNRTVKLQGTPQRIVSLAPSNTEILFAVGAGKQVVGRDSFSDYPPEAKSIQDIGGSMGKYDTEAIVALHPDLVLAGEINTPELVNSLQQLGLTVYYLPNPTTLEAMYANLETVGQLTGHSSEAATLVNCLKTAGGRGGCQDQAAEFLSRPSITNWTPPTRPSRILPAPALSWTC